MIDEAYLHASEAVGMKVSKGNLHPLPKGLHTVTIGDWELTLNTSREVQWLEDIAPIPPNAMLARHLKFMIIARLEPYYSSIGGDITEDQFLAEMQSLADMIDDPV